MDTTTVNYVGERLWAGQLGNAFVVLSFVAALVAFFAYFAYAREKDNLSWRSLARWAFSVHSLAVFGIAATLFYMLFNRFFEYSYVWQHSNSEMPMQYILSCFWEGQEGSFLLWTFWNVVLGNLLRRSLNEDWEGPVMMVFALVQVFLASMLLGIYVGAFKIGSNPFLLLRENPEFANLPFVQNPHYLEKLDGRGLNPLLMNYWMTIHPPTLFLGFASTLIPFAFAIAGLWNRRFDAWQKIALPWTFFGIMILGTGILMGGAWAYEALSFGGFWAWDPVENSSLVPWLVLVGAGHVMIVNKNKGGSLFTTHFLSIASFLLVLYSTFLTRSGILGESSVHAFTDLGMQGQLVLYVLAFVLITVALLIHDQLIRVSYILGSILLLLIAGLYGYKKIILLGWCGASLGLTVYAYLRYFPKEKDEEDLYSREFWLFIGSLLLLLSSLTITYFTSVPVFNKLFGTEKAPIKPEGYNHWQMPFAIAIALLVAVAQYFKYRKTNGKEFFRQLRIPLLLSVVFGLSSAIPLYFSKDFSEGSTQQKWDAVSYAILLIASLFAVFCNADYWLRVLKGHVRKAGASIAHIGFALVLLGALVSTSKKLTLSKDSASNSVEKLGENFNRQKSLLLTQGDTLPLGPYMATYVGKERKGIDVYFHVKYYDRKPDGKLDYLFELSPKVQDNPRMGKAPEPATRHYLNRDIYTHVTYADLNTELPANKEAYATAKNYVGHMGDTIFASNAFVIIDSLRTNLNQEEFEKNPNSLEVTAVLKAITADGKVYHAYPKYILKQSMIMPQEALIEELGLKLNFWKINPEDGSVEITMSEKVSNSKDFIVLEAYMFPYINILWLGCVVMVIGTIIAIFERVRQNKRTAKPSLE